MKNDNIDYLRGQIDMFSEISRFARMNLNKINLLDEINKIGEKLAVELKRLK